MELKDYKDRLASAKVACLVCNQYSAHSLVAHLKEVHSLSPGQYKGKWEGARLVSPVLYHLRPYLWDTKVRAKMIKDSRDLIGLVHLNAPDKDVELGSYQDRHNSPFSSFRLDSEALVIDLVKRYPCILERRSLAIQKLDSEYIYSLFD